MKSAKTGWMRGKALRVLLALRGLQPGDEVLLKRTGDWELDSDTVVGGPFSPQKVWIYLSTDDDPTHPINLVDKRARAGVFPSDPGGWDECVNIRHIRAWRRP